MIATVRRTLLRSAILTLLLPISANAQGPIEVQAVPGVPFGVGVIALQASPEMLPEPLGMEGLGLTEKNGRVFYPAMQAAPMGKLLKEVLNKDTPLTTGGPVRQQVGGILRGILNRPPRTTLYFLFRGEAPLEISLQAKQAISITVQPRANPALHQQLLGAWWQNYNVPRRLFEQKPDYPPVVETFLMNTLVRRLNLALPRDKISESGYQQFEHELGALAGSEGIRTAIERDRLLGLMNLGLPADRPLPPVAEVLPLEMPEPPKDVKIEPIAQHVPAEFFYIRFGSFENFLWLQDTLETWGGDIQNLMAKRGLNDGRNQRIQNQLVLEQTQLSRMLGPTVISDVAMVGSDLLMQDGAAIGFMFEARNNLILGSSLAGPRADRVRRGLAKEVKVKIEGQDVSYLSSPDGSIRSYYAASGDYHFVSSSRTLMARFLQTAKGVGSLGASKEFHHARSVMPIDRGDAVFVYFSDAFFRNFMSPRYRIETLRRLQAAVDIEIVQLAKLNAATEGKPASSIAELVAGGFLPPGFGPRSDGSESVIGKGEIYDSMRGRRGSFIPVPDLPVEQISAAEADSYARFVAYSAENFGRVEPMFVGLQRKTLPGKREQITVDARMTPLQRKRIDFFAKHAGPVQNDQFAAVAGNMASLEVSLPNERVAGGLQDVTPTTSQINSSILSLLNLPTMVVGYLGYQGDPGPFQLLNVLFLRQPDSHGFTSNLLGLWRLQYGPSVLYSFHAEILAAVAPQLHFEPAQYPAQLRLHCDDPTAAKIAGFLNNWGYSRTRETALGNLRLMHSLNQQLHVPVKDCREAAEFLLAAKLVCPLGGDYILRDVPGGESVWTAGSLEAFQPQGGLVPTAPQDYVAPPLNWFRGLDLHAALVGNLLSAHAEVIMQLPNAKK